MATLFLFDLDGTLAAIRAGRRAFVRAFAEVAGISDADAGVMFAGKTDLALFREIITARGLESVTPEAMVPVYLRHLEQEVAADPGRLYPGVTELLDALAAERDVYLALGTGNLEPGARIKLEPHGLNPYFPVGGFGSDSESRPELIRQGIAKAQAYYGLPGFDQVVVVGDTPLDIDCGKANGAATVAVAQSRYSTDALRAAGADLVFPALSDVPRVLAALRELVA